MLLHKAQGILTDVDNLTSTLGAMSALEQGQLTIACPSMLATYFLPNLLSGFLTSYPGLKASVTQAGTTRVEQMLLADEIEIGVTTSLDSPAEGELEIIPLIHEQMVLCVADNHPWATRTEIKIEELDGLPMVVYESGYFIRKRLDQLCAAAGVEPDYRMQTNFLPLLRRV